MKSRILSLAAIAGMLVATGCSGGGAGVTGVNAPVAPPTGGTPAKGTSSISASFLIPVSASQAAAMSSGRQAKYLSPGTNGISVLMGNGLAVVGAAGLSGTAQMTGQTDEDGAGGATRNVSFLSASNSTTPVVGQTLTITHTSAAIGANVAAPGQRSAVFTISAILSPTIVQGTFAPGTGAAATQANPPIALATAITSYTAGDLITFVAAGASTNGQQFIVGNQNTGAGLTPAAVVNAPIPSTVFPATAASTYSYNFVPSTVAGYYVFNLTINNLVAGSAMTLGVVTTDLNNKNFVLSEAQQAYVVPTSGLTGQVTPFTLKPVVNGVFVPAPSVIIPPQLGNTAAAASSAVVGTLETTVFAVDELGYIIPTVNGAAVGSIPDNIPATAMITIAATTPANLVFNRYAAAVTTSSATPLTFVPKAPQAIAVSLAANQFTLGNGATDFANVTGSFYTAIGSGSAPGTLAFGGTNVAGTPLNVVCNANVASVAWAATIQSAAPVGSVTGYVLTPGTNYPSNTAFTQALPAINCSPGVGGVIN